tara:strand:+ start:491 stop:736 length:246 start_codon:yes stop_codon:yes gene_type:complete
MILINGIQIPEDTKSIKLEPSPELDKAIVDYDEDNDILIYDTKAIINCFIKQGMSEEAAYEWFHYNTLRTADYVKNYPNFI